MMYKPRCRPLQDRMRHWKVAKTVMLSGMALTSIPPEVGSMAGDAQMLDLHDNKLDLLPNLGALTALRRLHLGSNHLTATSLPDMSSCQQLSCLVLCSNRCGCWSTAG